MQKGHLWQRRQSKIFFSRQNFLDQFGKVSSNNPIQRRPSGWWTILPRSASLVGRVRMIIVSRRFGFGTPKNKGPKNPLMGLHSACANGIVSAEVQPISQGETQNFPPHCLNAPPLSWFWVKISDFPGTGWGKGKNPEVSVWVLLSLHIFMAKTSCPAAYGHPGHWLQLLLPASDRSNLCGKAKGRNSLVNQVFGEWIFSKTFRICHWNESWCKS